jgi:hypothetical protein
MLLLAPLENSTDLSTSRWKSELVPDRYSASESKCPSVRIATEVSTYQEIDTNILRTGYLHSRIES